MNVSITLESPLNTAWTRQYVRVALPGTVPCRDGMLTESGLSVPFQFTGRVDQNGAEILLPVEFETGQCRTYSYEASSDAQLPFFTEKKIPLENGVVLNKGVVVLELAAPVVNDGFVEGPFRAVGTQGMQSRIACKRPFESAELILVNDGVLYAEYHLIYHFADQKNYRLVIRLYKSDPWIEVEEEFSLGFGGQLQWIMNPEQKWDRFLSNRGADFENETQPVEEPLVMRRPSDILVRLQKPAMNEYFIPKNAYWMAWYDSRKTHDGMFGILGLRGETWREPVSNMPIVHADSGRVCWTACLGNGSRAWLMAHSAVEREYTPERRFLYHRLHAEWNALRLSDHLDLVCKGSEKQVAADVRTGFFPDGDLHQRLVDKAASLKPLQEAFESCENKIRDAGDLSARFHDRLVVAVLHPDEEHLRAVYDEIVRRFTLWIRQFQGYRQGVHDYAKNVIGFSRLLRGLLLGYELLCRHAWMTERQKSLLDSYFQFAAQRIADEDRWPHSRTFLHPDHPESVRDFYAYGGEHKPDRLVWTNSLPNFQSDPLCALAHLSALFAHDPKSKQWQRMALDDIDRQLSAYCSSSGAWAESIIYALYTLSYFCITFRVIKNRLGIDYFQDERVRRMVGWLVRFFGPEDKRFGSPTWPGIGNSRLPQQGGQMLLAFAGELPEDDALRRQCIAIYQAQEHIIRLKEYEPLLVAMMAPVVNERIPLPTFTDEHMQDLGVAMRHGQGSEQETYLFQKIGFWKDHYENDETAFNWYAKGAPLMMDYGTYTPDAAIAAAHNLVEIPDMDALRRGYLASHHFSSKLAYTQCDVPLTQKLLWEDVRTFEQQDHGSIHRDDTPYYYIGDPNPVGPKAWKTRKLLFVKPDYLVLSDRVYGAVDHRLNLHVNATEMRVTQDGFYAPGEFGVNLHCHLHGFGTLQQKTGTFTPKVQDNDSGQKQTQYFMRLYNKNDGVYRTLLFAQESGQDVQIRPVGDFGWVVTTKLYTDFVVVSDHWLSVEEKVDGQTYEFCGCTGWIRRHVGGAVNAALIEGESFAGLGARFSGRGPWLYNIDQPDAFQLLGGPERSLSVVY